MKAVFIAYDQAYHEQILTILNYAHIKGFTSWQEVQGRGSVTGEPHFGTHAWPSLNSSMLTVIPDEKVKSLLDELRKLEATSKLMGLRAFVWNVEDGI
ncbi:MAG: hypothetical protein KA206_09645 [Paludibacter sp.]|nr:hypothetical protein [Paludibacter sp.]